MCVCGNAGTHARTREREREGRSIVRFGDISSRLSVEGARHTSEMVLVQIQIWAVYTDTLHDMRIKP